MSTGPASGKLYGMHGRERSRRGVRVALTVALALPWAWACPEEGAFDADAASDGSPFQRDLRVVDAYVNPCAPGPPPSVSGVVLAPNGVDPVAGASVGVPITLAVLPATVACESCTLMGDFAAHTRAAADGSFKLSGVPNGLPFKLALRKGHFRRIVEVPALKCGSQKLTAAETTLPGRSGQYSKWDTSPKIAVVTGAWDKLEKVLDKLGVQQKDVYNGTDWNASGSYTMQALLQNLGRMKGYHLILINCGTKFESLVTASGAVRENIRQYVKEGGRLFTTDFSYDYVEQVFPEFIDFQGSEATAAGVPEEQNAAEVGSKGLIVDATVQDSMLSSWLGLPQIDALQKGGAAAGRVRIEGFMEGWAVQKAVSSAVSAKVWVEGKVSWWGGLAVRPLTATYYYRGPDNTGCGRVLFSSYHTYGNSASLLPQERILEYLVLEIGDCRMLE